ncbi:MAG TPA: thiamine pyrophosphate-dependent enzyme, partial [Smithellaceae bacterium]|nr:thiamine pyrophosphate-dependent enzyme [Smithellaceae bacterium]
LSRCALWREKYPVVTPKHLENGDANVYAFIKKISQAIEENTITVVGNGSASVVGSHAFVIKKGSRFIINSAIASMGYDLPAATGACFASGGEDVICITGDGSIQMNIQELQTIVHHKLPVKLFVINNGGYHSIRQTQSKFFGGPLDPVVRHHLLRRYVGAHLAQRLAARNLISVGINDSKVFHAVVASRKRASDLCACRNDLGVISFQARDHDVDPGGGQGIRRW